MLANAEGSHEPDAAWGAGESRRASGRGKTKAQTHLSCVRLCTKLTSSTRFTPGLKIANQSLPSFLNSGDTPCGSRSSGNPPAPPPSGTSVPLPPAPVPAPVPLLPPLPDAPAPPLPLPPALFMILFGFAELDGASFCVYPPAAPASAPCPCGCESGCGCGGSPGPPMLMLMPSPIPLALEDGMLVLPLPELGFWFWFWFELGLGLLRLLMLDEEPAPVAEVLGTGPGIGTETGGSLGVGPPAPREGLNGSMRCYGVSG